VEPSEEEQAAAWAGTSLPVFDEKVGKLDQQALSIA
jgi:hypothetical protein